MTLRWRNPFYFEEPYRAPIPPSIPIPKFCGVSGDRLELVKRTLWFNTATGDPIYRYWWACPKAKDKESGRSWTGRDVRQVNCDGTEWTTGYSLWGGDSHLDCSEKPEGWEPSTSFLVNR